MKDLPFEPQPEILWERAQALADAGGAAGGLRSYLQTNFETVRLRLGTSLADVKIPFVLGPNERRAIDQGVAELLALCCQRYKEGWAKPEYDRLLLSDISADVNVRGRSFTTAGADPASLQVKLYTQAMAACPALDIGILSAWLGKGRGGRELFGKVSALIQRAWTTEQGVAGQTGEPTLLLVLAMLTGKIRAMVDKRLQTLGDLSVRDRVGQMLAAAISALVRTVLDEAVIKVLPPNMRDHRTLMIAETALAPAVFLPDAMLNTPPVWPAVGTYVPAIADKQRPTVRKAFESVSARERLMETLVKRLSAGKEDVQQLIVEQRAHVLRVATFAALTGYRLSSDDASGGPYSSFYLRFIELLQSSELLYRTVEQEKALKGLISSLKGYAARELKGGDSTAGVLTDWVELADAACDLSVGLFSGREVAENAATGVAKLLYLDEVTNASVGALRDLSSVCAEVGADWDIRKIKEAFEAGEVYRLIADGESILKSAEVVNEAQFFIDLKDFTKRTFSLKEAAMADFMKEEFYKPILAAAKPYFKGMGHLADRGSINLNNLLGDAVSMSGNIENLLEFTFDLQRVLGQYREKLQEQVTASQVTEKLQQARLAHLERVGKLDQEIDKLRIELTRLQMEGGVDGPGQEPVKMQLAQLEKQREELVSAHEEKQGSIAGLDLEAGAMISFGQAAHHLRWHDDIWSEVHVAIGEKINQSARGTSRDAAVYAKYQAWLEKEREQQGNPDLVFPGRAFVDDCLEVQMPMQFATRLDEALAAGDNAAVSAAIDELHQVYRADVNEPVSRIFTRSSAIYNNGAILSGEALTEYLSLASRGSTIIEKEMSPEQFHQDIVRRFVFAHTPVKLKAAADNEKPDRVRIFMYIGDMTFKGFEKREPLPIWELLDPGGEFAAKLIDLHLPQWLNEFGGGYHG